MFKILIADDEKFIRKGIISILQRDLEEEVECLEARNGIQALEIVDRLTPDLVISDISMPGCDGLEFIAKIRENYKNITVIILSGYENFEYAKKAIRLGVKEYIMKPIKKQEFLETIKNYIESIKEVKQSSNEEIIKNIERRNIVEGLRRDYLAGLLSCSNSAEAGTYILNLKGLGLSFKSNLLTCAVMQYQVTRENQEYVDFAVKNIVDEYLNMQPDAELVLSVQYGKGKLAIIFENENHKIESKEKVILLRKASKLVEKNCNTKVFTGVGDVAYDPLYLHKSFNHALKAGMYKIYSDGTCIEEYEQIQDKKMNESECRAIHIAEKLKMTQSVDVFRILNDFNSLINEARSGAGLELLISEYNQVKKVLADQAGYYQFGNYSDKLQMKEFDEFWEFTELKREIKNSIEKVIVIIANPPGDLSNRKLIADILAFIRENLTQDIDLNIVADHFGRSPGYISTLFKRISSEGFNAYVTNERINIAKKLLSDPTIPIQRVSELCGYSNAKYFSVVFKKTTGTTPKDFRDCIN